MYEKFYKLKEKPFRIVPDPAYLFMSPKHQNALTYLEYGLTEGTGFILLTGEIGAGKTTLIRHILNDIESKMEVAVIFNTNINSDQLLNLIINEFELGIEENKIKALESLYQFLIEKYSAGKRILLIIDEAQNLSKEVLEEVRMLSNLQSDNKVLLQIMLVGQPELKRKLKTPELAQFAQRITVSYHLPNLSRTETGSYIAYRLERGGGMADIFNPQAVNLIYKASNGNPRIINMLCDASLVYGFADEIETINADIIEQVIKDNDSINYHFETEKQDHPASEPGGVIPDGLIKDEFSDRLQILESDVMHLKLLVGSHIEELENRAENFKDNLVNQLENLLRSERKRTDAQLISYSALKDKYETFKHSVLKEKAEKKEIKTNNKQISSAPVTIKNILKQLNILAIHRAFRNKRRNR